MIELILGNFPTVSVNKLVGEIEKKFGKETISNQAVELIKQLAGSDYIYPKEALTIIENVLRYRCTCIKTSASGIFYSFIEI